MKKFIKKNYKIVIAFILGGIVFGGIGVYASTNLSSSEVSYDNSKSNSLSNNVQGSIEELYKKSSNCTTGSCSLTQSNFYVEYTYNQTSGASNYCVTGDEATCTRTDCYTSSNKTCPAGTIIDYIVSGTNTRVRFHVIQDKGKTITMQTQKNIINNIAWYAGDINSYGPTKVLPMLENATSSWSNVNTQTYTIGNSFLSGCSEYNSCTTNKYTLAQRTAKARLATVQELANVGCTRATGSCPKWVYNYLYSSTDFGGSVSDTTTDGGDGRYGYWTMNAYTGSSDFVWHIGRQGRLWYTISPTYPGIGARAVVEVSK